MRHLRNVPDDWDCYWRTCEFCRQSYHAADGGCDCDHPNKRPEHRAMEAAGYDYKGNGEWEKEISWKRRKCRRDHKSGRVKKGDSYNEVVTRTIWFTDEGDCDYSRITKYIMVLDKPFNKKFTNSYPSEG